MPASKSANLCWGQRYHWLRYQQVPPEARHEAHIVDTFPLPPGVSPAQIRSLLNCLVRRHEVMRTVYDHTAQPWPRQRVQPPGPLAVHTATTEADGTPAPAEAVHELTVAAFDPARDWPVRACVVTTGGAAKRLVLVFNHLAFDDQSLALLRREFQTLLEANLAGRPAVLAPVAWQPADLARYESSGAAVPDAAIEHWRGQLERLPADVFARRRGRAGGPDACCSASFTSPSLLAAGQEIAARLHVWPSAVHLAAYAVTMAAYTGEPLITHRMYTSQREASGHAPVLTCMSFPTPVLVDLAGDPPFSEVVRRAAAQVDQSMAHAHVPYDELAELVSREGVRRGQPLRGGSDINFLSNAPRSCGTRRERFAWNAEPTQWAQSGADTYLRVYEWSDAVTLMLQATAEVMDPDSVERFLRGYCSLLDAHRDPALDLPASQAGAAMGFTPLAAHEWVRVGPDTVDLAATEAALAAHPAVVSARVSQDGRDLVAHVITDRPVSAADLRTHLLASVGAHPAARCPDWFVLSAAEAGAPEVRNDGRDSPVRPPATAAEQALATVVAETNALGRVDLSASYVTAGGRALRMPGVLEALREQGWDGLSTAHLAGVRPLWALAEMLVRP